MHNRSDGGKHVAYRIQDYPGKLAGESMTDTPDDLFKKMFGGIRFFHCHPMKRSVSIHARRDEPGSAIQIILQCRLNIDRPIIQIILRCRLKIDSSKRSADSHQTGNKNHTPSGSRRWNAGGCRPGKRKGCQRRNGQKVRMTLDITGAVLIPLCGTGSAFWVYPGLFVFFWHACIERVKTNWYNSINQIERTR